MPLARAICFTLVLGSAVRAQDLNIDFGPPPAPQPGYAAASGQSGAWNSIVFPSGNTALTDLAGQPTTVQATPFLGMYCDMYTCAACSSAGCPGFAGSSDDERLLGGWINADCALSVTGFSFSGLEPGRYAAHVYTYGCPSTPAASTNLHAGGVSFTFSTSGQVFTGNWSGFPVGRHAFHVPDGSFSLSCWGTGETGLAGLQLDRLDPVGLAGCFGDGSGGVCPCANFGLAGHGCRNSAAMRGAELGAVGTPSPSFDTVGFECTFLPANSASVLLQGDQTIMPTSFGDGLRCIGGGLRRLFLANARAVGALSLPANGAAPIAQRSAALGDVLAPGSLRTYQIYYRDPDPAFCPAPQGSTFNISNSLQLQWQP